jgi:hypothetical protein
MNNSKNIEIVKLQGRGNGFFVKNCRSKREREYLINKVIKASNGYRLLYKLRNCFGI